MSQSDFNIVDSNGATFLIALNNAIQAAISQSAGATAPTTTYAYQFWYDTTNSLLKQRNAANNAWVTIGSAADVSQLTLYANNTLSFKLDGAGNAIIYGTGGIQVPVGTTAQRPTAAQGQIRYNTSLSQFEGYNGSAWGAIGGAGNVVVDTFSGNGSTTAFTLSQAPSSANATWVFISGVYQAKANYSISGTTLTFTTAPPSGTNNIQVISNGAISIGTPSDGTVTPAKLSTGGPSWDTSGNVTARSIAFTANAGIIGQTSGTSAAAGSVGEILSTPVSFASAVSLTTGVTANVATLLLSAGDWLVWGNVAFDTAGTTVVTTAVAGISDTSATLKLDPTQGSQQGWYVGSAITGVTPPQSPPPVHIVTSINKTMYLVASSSFGTSTQKAYGWIMAQRIR